MLSLFVYGLQLYGQLNNSCPLYSLFCSVLQFKKKIGKVDVAAFVIRVAE